MTADTPLKSDNPQFDATLVEAALKNDAVLTASLLDQGANPDVRVDAEANAPLLLVILGWRSNPNMKVYSAAHAQAQQSKRIIELLVEAGADIHACAPDGSNALLLALVLDWSDVTDYLLNQGIDVNVHSSMSGYTPLMLSTDVGLLYRLLDRGAFIDAQDNLGNTALMMAVHRKQVDRVRALLERGADIRLKCRNRVDHALSYARFGQDEEIVLLLEQANKSGL